MTTPSADIVNWRSYLQLVEELLNQQNAASLAAFLNQRVQSLLDCAAVLWFVEPFFPLPGEPEIQTIPSSPAPEIVLQAYKENQPHILESKSIVEGHQQEKFELALPCVTQSNLLAVLHVTREKKFSTAEKELLSGITSHAAVAMQVNRQVTLKNWRFDQISLVRSVSSQISNITDLDTLSRRVTALIQCSFDFYYVSIFTLDSPSDLLHMRASSRDCNETSKSPVFTVKVGEGIIGHVAATGKEYIARDVSNDSLFRAIESLPETKSEVVLPLVVENRIMGVMDLQSNKKVTFHENDLMVLRSLADNIALAVESTRLYSSLKRHADQLSAVLEINFALSSILDLEELLEEIVKLIQNRFDYPFVHIFTVHPGRQKVVYQTGTAKRSHYLKNHSFAFDLNADHGMVPYVARSGKPLLANDVTTEPTYRSSRLPPSDTKSELDIPLVFGNEVLGVLDFQSDQLNAFDQSDLELFEALGSGIALALRNATLFRTEKWRRQVSDSFRDVAGLLSTNLELSNLLDKVLSELDKNLPCDAAAIWLLDDMEQISTEQRPLRLAAVHGTSWKKVAEARQKSDATRQYLDNAMDSDKPVIRQSKDPFGPLGAACGFSSRYSSIAVPLKAGDQILGILTLAHHTEGRYGSEASSISSTFASYAAVAIQNAKLYSSAQEDAWSSTVLLHVAEATQTINNVDELLSTMVRLTPLLVGINQCAFFVRNEEKECFTMKTWYGFHPGEKETDFREDEQVAFLRLMATRSPVFIKDPQQELGLTTLTRSDEHGTLVMVPLIAHSELLGAFLVSHLNSGEFGIDNPFKEQTLAIIQGIAQQTSVALENIHLVEKQQEEAYATAVLLQVAQAVVSQNELADIIDTIVHLMPILVGVDTCAIYLWDKNNQMFIPQKSVSPNHQVEESLLQTNIRPGDFPFFERILATNKLVACPMEDAEMPFENWTTLACTSVNDPTVLAPVKAKNWLLGFPLSLKGEILGVMLTKESNVPAAFHNKRIEILNGVASQISLAIQNERFTNEMVDRERLEREMQLARQIQETFLPNELPHIKGWDLDLRWKTAREVGGDFYDLFYTRDRKLALAIADVADKGMPAALYMTVTRTLIRSISQSVKSPGKVLHRVNELLMMDSQNGMFVTAVFAILDPATGMLTYANAGHNLPLLLRHHSKEVERLPKGAIALAVVDNAVYEDHEISINKGDALLLYTDGVTEAFSSSGTQFTESRLKEAMIAAGGLSSGKILGSIETIIDEFRNGEPASDDLTMICISRK